MDVEDFINSIGNDACDSYVLLYCRGEACVINSNAYLWLDGLYNDAVDETIRILSDKDAYHEAREGILVGEADEYIYGVTAYAFDSAAHRYEFVEQYADDHREPFFLPEWGIEELEDWCESLSYSLFSDVCKVASVRKLLGAS